MTLLSSVITYSVAYIKYDMDMLKKRLEILHAYNCQGHVREKKEQTKQEQHTFFR